MTLIFIALAGIVAIALLLFIRKLWAALENSTKAVSSLEKKLQIQGQRLQQLDRQLNSIEKQPGHDENYQPDSSPFEGDAP